MKDCVLSVYFHLKSEMCSMGRQGFLKTIVFSSAKNLTSAKLQELARTLEVFLSKASFHVFDGQSFGACIYELMIGTFSFAANHTGQFGILTDNRRKGLIKSLVMRNPWKQLGSTALKGCRFLLGFSFDDLHSR
eukprot:gnl/MRDRNA2_/MRDRNA2_206001_c0_seq1.p2 gnl/MRDRNA2_/MRDRNA2_206001_c0~~gnl/MRDRNA2_/MRDRNA2_206001_c0_seq1.p2  ORF type:complete len:134 (+),score=20.64 gnl/MRDRNA2_/MRDRNA2_206001_c0_seq1:773-1174(+)